MYTPSGLAVWAGSMRERSDPGLGSLEFTFLMFSMTTCLPLFFLGPMAYGLGLSLWQALVAALAGNLVVAAAMIVNGRIGVERGIDYSEHARLVFGAFHRIPVILRGLVGGLWYGVEAFNGALAMTLIALYLLGYDGDLMVEALKLLPVMLAVYVASATLVYKRGIREVGRVATYAGPILLLYFAYLAVRDGGLSLSPAGQAVAGVAWTSAAFLTYLAVQTNWWATVAVNISDLSREARSLRAVAVGVLVGMVGGQLAGTLLGYVLASRSGSLLPHEIILNESPGALAVLLGLAFAFIAPWTTDLAANIPALDGLLRGALRVPARRAAVVAGALGFILAPWYAMDRAQDIVGYVTAFAASYGVLLGPVLGSMLAYAVDRRVGGAPAFAATLLGIVASYAYSIAAGDMTSVGLGGVEIPFPSGITIYVGLASSMVLSVALARTSSRAGE